RSLLTEHSWQRHREHSAPQRCGSAGQQHQKAVAIEPELSWCCRKALRTPSIQASASTSRAGLLRPLVGPNGRAPQPAARPLLLVLARPKSPQRRRPRTQPVVSSRPRLSQAARDLSRNSQTTIALTTRRYHATEPGICPGRRTYSHYANQLRLCSWV